MNLQVGMLWYDDSPQRSLGHKIDLAVKHYRDKYGASPNVCYVNPAALNGGSADGSNLQVIAADFVLPHHLWIGVAKVA